MESAIKPWYFEDYEVGQVIETPGRTITDADIVSFGAITADFSSIHFDDTYAKKTIYGTRIAHGMLTISYALGLYTRLMTSYGTGMGNMGISCRFTHPVRVGDTIRVIAEIIQARPTRKPDRGIVKFHFNVVNQDGTTVCDAEYTHMVRTRAGAQK